VQIDATQDKDQVQQAVREAFGLPAFKPEPSAQQ
jgi:hypothetical protein